MSNSEKKIAFSFSKVKKPVLAKTRNTEFKEKLDYVDCFDCSKGKFSYKGNIRSDENVKQELVIPMPNRKTSDEILRSRIEASKNLGKRAGNEFREKNNKESETSIQHSTNFDDLAALEILNEIKSDQVKSQEKSKLIIETKDVPSEVSENDIDYDNIPVTEFGLALLRGMGWKPDQGIGKQPRIVEAASPNLRPKGLGLGAKISTGENNSTEEKNNKNKKVQKTK